MNEEHALLVVAMISTATGQAWSADRIKLYRALLMEARIPFEPTMRAAKLLLSQVDPMKIYPALLIAEAKRLIPERPQLEGPVEPLTKQQAAEALEKLASHPALMKAFKHMRTKMQERTAALK